MLTFVIFENSASVVLQSRIPSFYNFKSSCATVVDIKGHIVE